MYFLSCEEIKTVIIIIIIIIILLLLQTTLRFRTLKKDLKIGLSSVGKMYVVSALLRNALICLNGNQTSSFFQLDPPLLEDYFS